MILLKIALAGLLGTFAMNLVMSLIHSMKWANADMVRAIGSIYTRSLEDSFWPGLFIHCAIGTAFAFLYALFLGNAPGIGPREMCALGTMLGLAHGLWVGLLLVIEVAEYHPLPEFRDVGFGVAIAHGIGHVFYGFTVGLVLALNFTAVQTAVQDFNVRALADFIGYTVVWAPLFGIPLAFCAYVAYVGYSAWRKHI